MSNRRGRQWERLPPEDKLLAEVRRVGTRPIVQSIEDHFAGYFNELGITFKVEEAATDEEIRDLRNDVLTCLMEVAARENIKFTWQASIKRGREQVVLLFPGDSLMPAGIPLELIYR